MGIILIKTAKTVIHVADKSTTSARWRCGTFCLHCIVEEQFLVTFVWGRIVGKWRISVSKLH
jgi:hypothetical protein